MVPSLTGRQDGDEDEDEDDNDDDDDAAGLGCSAGPDCRTRRAGVVAKTRSPHVTSHPQLGPGAEHARVCKMDGLFLELVQDKKKTVEQ